MFEYKGIKIRWYGHDTFTLEKSIIICIDPYKLSRSINPDIILISHNHFDHMSLDDLEKIKPKIAIPMHYGTIVGSDADAKEFKDTVKSCKVHILTKE